MTVAFLIIGIVVGLFASLIAFLITYDEYSHHYVDKRNPLRLAVEAAVFAFVVFFLLAMITGFVLVKTYMSQ
jgi:H+/Cl- antiporter ClcA